MCIGNVAISFSAKAISSAVGSEMFTPCLHPAMLMDIRFITHLMVFSIETIKTGWFAPWLPVISSPETSRPDATHSAKFNANAVFPLEGADAKTHNSPFPKP
jgi:hypothetical protein